MWLELRRKEEGKEERLYLSIKYELKRMCVDGRLGLSKRYLHSQVSDENNDAEPKTSEPRQIIRGI